jgi:glutaredoxin-related protein
MQNFISIKKVITNSKIHLYVMGLGDNPICRKCGTDEETSVRILCKCEALASDIHNWGPSFWIRRILGNWA